MTPPWLKKNRQSNELDWKELLPYHIRHLNDPDSHVEKDPYTIHPSQLSQCERQCVISKYGLKEHSDKTLGTFRIGTIVHEWIERQFDSPLSPVRFEVPVKLEAPPVTIVGRADCYDPVTETVYDFKTRGGWYRFDPPKESHVDQLTLYMNALDASKGQVVYIDKKSLEVRTWPENGTFEFDEKRCYYLIEKAKRIGERLEREGTPESIDDVPFDRCDCWLCQWEGDSDD